MTLVSRDKRQILGYDIAFDRSRERIQKLVDKSAKASKDKYEQGLNDYYKNHGINKTKVDNTNYIDLSKNDDDAR